MKSLYIIAFLALGLNIYAQENKKVSETTVQEAENYKESKAFEAKMMKEAQEKSAQKPSTVTLASEQGLEVKQQQSPKQEVAKSSGKLITSASSIEEIQASIPGRKAHKENISNSSQNNTKGLLPSPNLTLEDIKKTIPKN
jgi:hypothetical protein